VTDATETTETTEIPTSAEVDSMVAVAERRKPLGRLYHGETSIDFYGRRWWWLGMSLVLIAVTLVSIVANGLNLGIDFKGGVAWEVSAANISEQQARTILDDNGIAGASAKIQKRTSSSGSVLLIQVGDQTPQKRQEVQTALATAAKVQVGDVSTSSVSSTWGRSITEKAIRALVIFFVLVLMFISWRLEWRMAIAAILAMIHDVVISVGVYSVFKFEVTPATVVAFLTILGYSLYDSIVVFDKVKENEIRYTGVRIAYADIMNVSMNQVLMRSLNTTLSSVLPVLSLLVLGAGFMGAVTLREFALALLVGLLIGSYSSIFVASPLVVVAKQREPKFRAFRGQHSTGVDLERLVLGGAPTGRHGARARATVAEPLPPGVAATPQALLTHPPRPRKKKRRVT
jgi:preprotein translocase subunit SecF